MFCQIQGHDEFQQSNICVFPNCYQASRLMCQICIEELKHKHDKVLEIIKVELFQEYFNEYTLVQLEIRLQSKNGHQQKYIYLQKVCTELQINQSNFNNQIKQYQNRELKVQAQKLQEIKQIVTKLIASYKEELFQIQKLQKVYQKLRLTGLFSLDKDQLNDLLNCHRHFFNEEIQVYQNLNKKMAKFSDIICKYPNVDLYQNSIEQCVKLQKINDFIDFQQSKQFKQELFSNRSFFSKNDKYFALISKDNKLKIRNQQNFKIIQNIKFNGKIDLIEFDLFFKYFVIFEKNCLSFYVLTKNKEFKMIKQFRYKYGANELFLSSLNKVILVNRNQYSIKSVIKTVNFKNNCVNKIITGLNDYVCYGKQKNIIAIYSTNNQVINFFQDIQNQPFITIRNCKIDEMIFIDNDLKLLTQNQRNVSLWQVDYINLQTILTKKIEKDWRNKNRWSIINQAEFHIIKFSTKGKFEIFDKNFKLYFRFSELNLQLGKMVYLTKSFIIFNVNYDVDSYSKLIKRKLMTDYELLEKL